MIKKNAKNILFSAIAYIIVLIVCMAMFLPRNVGGTFDATGSPSATYEASDVSQEIRCKLEQDGTYIILSPDPQLMFAVEDIKTECIKLTVVSQNEQNVPFEIYTALNDGKFSEERCYKGNIFKGNQSAVVDIPKGEYSYLRVDIDQINVKFESVELFTSEPTLVPYKPKFPVGHYVVTAILPLIMAVFAWLLNKRLKIVEKVITSLSKNKYKILTVSIFTVVALLVAVLIELIFGLIYTQQFNVYRWIVFAGVSELVVTFVFGYKCLKENPEKVFLPIVLILGMVMLFSLPIQHICWDLDSHYPWAVQASYPGTTYVTNSYNAIDFAYPQTTISSDDNYVEDLKYLSQADKEFLSEKESELSIAHLPAGIFIAVTRWFGGGFVAKYNLGRLAYLLIYSFVCYFAIKKIKSGKMILSIICLFPTNLFLATNYAYDWCVTAFTILGTAYFVSELQEPDKPITIKDTIIMGLAFAVGALPKLVYIILMGMTLFVRKNWTSKKDKQRYYLVLGIMFAVVFAMFLLRSTSSLSGSGDTRGGAVNPAEQVSGILGNPLNYAKVLFNFLLRYLSIPNMKEYISNFAYLGA